MLNGFRTTTARAVQTAIARPCSAPRPLYAAIRQPNLSAIARAFHSATAEFVNLGPEGTIVTKDISIFVGEPKEAYVLIPPEVGKRSDRLSLSYLHDIQRLAFDSSPGCYPYLVIPQQLPRQSTANTSPATLYLYGVMHTIALDGTPDEFAELASTIMPEIGEEVIKLKDM